MSQKQEPHAKQRQIEQLRKEIQKGIEQADRSELVDGETVFSNIRVKSHRRRSQRKHA